MEYIGFTDGAWKRSSNREIKSGSGGVLIDNSKVIVFTFVGRVNAKNPLIAEKEALLFLYSQVKSSESKLANFYRLHNFS